jgi:hypothetical protein
MQSLTLLEDVEDNLQEVNVRNGTKGKIEKNNHVIKQ